MTEEVEEENEEPSMGKREKTPVQESTREVGKHGIENKTTGGGEELTRVVKSTRALDT